MSLRKSIHAAYISYSLYLYDVPYFFLVYITIEFDVYSMLSFSVKITEETVNSWRSMEKTALTKSLHGKGKHQLTFLMFSWDEACNISFVTKQSFFRGGCRKMKIISSMNIV